ncbi:MAG TPA: tetratricopeptide repeat protein, partial [Anaerolineae bacterium]|nr:tetratricopeptide repeat protein [Anaerolineae bacterium]
MKKRLEYFFITALFFMVFAEIPVSAQESSNNLEKAKEALQTGDYLEARRLFQPLLENISEDEREQVLDYFETFLALGEYNEGIDEVNSYLNKTPHDPYLLHMKGRFLATIGKYKDAEIAFNDVQKIKEDFLQNQLELGVLLEKTGRKSYAYEYYRQITREYQQNRLRTAQSIGIAGKAFANLGDYHEANRVFKIAYEMDPKNVQNLYWWADLFREKFNNTDARRTFEEALLINPHSAELYVGYAHSFESLSQWEVLANKAIEENPNCVDALNILVEIHILDGNYDEAEKILNKTLEINPVYEQSLANLATVYHLRNEEDKFAQTEQKVQEMNPQCSDFYIILAENCIRRFRYKDAVSFCHKATLKEFDNWHVYALLGSNILRLGQVDEARIYLEKAYDGDPFDIYAHNTLELIDDYKDFVSTESEHFSLLIHSSENAVLAPPILALAEECYDSLRIRYPYNPEHKIRIEAYNDNDDFAVRISGLPGVDLLGVCFGDVVAFDTPNAQTDSEYNWSITLWHEIAHVMALGISDNKVPRWFTEG